MPPKSRTVRLVRVFVSSPSDVEEEKQILAEAVERINSNEGEENAIQLKLFTWNKDAVPQIGRRPQKVIDSQTPHYDIYLGIMSARFGTPACKHGSGTEKEFRDAAKRFAKEGMPWILFYFRNNPPTDGTTAALEQQLKVRRFRDELEKKGIVGLTTARAADRLRLIPEGRDGGVGFRVVRDLGPGLP